MTGMTAECPTIQIGSMQPESCDAIPEDCQTYHTVKCERYACERSSNAAAHADIIAWRLGSRSAAAAAATP